MYIKKGTKVKINHRKKGILEGTLKYDFYDNADEASSLLSINVDNSFFSINYIPYEDIEAILILEEPITNSEKRCIEELDTLYKKIEPYE